MADVTITLPETDLRVLQAAVDRLLGSIRSMRVVYRDWSVSDGVTASRTEQIETLERIRHRLREAADFGASV